MGVEGEVDGFIDLRLGGEELDLEACGDMQCGAFGLGGKSGGFADEAVLGLGGGEWKCEEEALKSHAKAQRRKVLKASGNLCAFA